jgi:hypothetical protein
VRRFVASRCVGESSVVKMESLVDDVDAVRGNIIGRKSRSVYINGIVRYVLWLHENKPDALATSLRARLHALDDTSVHEQDAKAIVHHFVSAIPLTSPIDLTAATARDFECFLVSLRKADGTLPGKAVYGSMRSSLFHLYRECEVTMPVEFAAELTLFFKGLKRTVAHRGGNIKEGKEPFEFSLFQLLCRTMQEEADAEFVFAHTFLVLSWNLMCRAGNTVSIRWEHVQWTQDALAIRFSHMKNDQEGDRRDPRHVYANPLMPQVCPILSLAIYVATLGFDASEMVFPGGNQYDRYTKILKRTMTAGPVKTALDDIGLSAADFGSHSARKGSATYVSSCSTAGPSASAVCLRAGWSLPGVQDTYVRYEAAGDRIVGRFVAGLPFQSSGFAMLPPFFANIDDEVRATAADQFPGAPATMHGAVVFLLASLVFHSDYLLAVLPATHPLLNTQLFRTHGLIASLKARVAGCNSQNEDTIRASGVPPHIGLLVAMDEQSSRLTALTAAVHGLVPSLARELDVALERRSRDNGLPTRASISTAIQDAIEATGLAELLRDVHNERERQQQLLATGGEETRSSTQPTVPVLAYGGRLHRVPEAFKFPRTTVALSWELWWFGNASHRWPPIRELVPSDMPSVNTRKRLSDFRYLMKHIEAAAAETGTFTSHPSLHQARAMLANASSQLPVPDRTARGQVRRVEQLQWPTVVNLLRLKTRAISQQGC